MVQCDSAQGPGGVALNVDWKRATQLGREALFDLVFEFGCGIRRGQAGVDFAAVVTPTGSIIIPSPSFT